MVSRYAVIVGGQVTNVVLWDGDLKSWTAPAGAQVVPFNPATHVVAVSPEAANRQTVEQNLTDLITSLQADVTQDNSVIAGANPIIATTGTLTSAQLSTHVRSLAQAVKTLASNDLNNKRAMQNLLHKIQGKYDDLTGT